MGNNSVNFLVKIPIRCWDINKTRQGITFICRTLYVRGKRGISHNGDTGNFSVLSLTSPQDKRQGRVTSPQQVGNFPVLRGIHGETCLMDFGHNATIKLSKSTVRVVDFITSEIRALWRQSGILVSPYCALYCQ